MSVSIVSIFTFKDDIMINLLGLYLLPFSETESFQWNYRVIEYEHVNILGICCDVSK